MRQVSAEVTGVDGHVGSVSVSRSLPSSLPGQGFLGGWAAATADLEMDRIKTVESRVGTPWSRRTWPESGDPVTIDATDGVNKHRIFTGRVDGTKSSLADAGISVGLVDDTDSLTASVSERPLFREMPPRATNGGGKNRQTGLLNTHVPNLAAREAGYYNTPPMMDYCLVSAPLVGSTWPERGVLRNSYRSTGVGHWYRSQPGAYTDTTPGTIYMSDVYAVYEPDYPAWEGGITESRPFSITLGARQSQATSSYVEAQWSGSNFLRQMRLAVTSSRSLYAQLITEGGGTTNVVWVGAGDAGPWEYATLRVLRVGDSVLEWQVHTDTGVVKTGRTTGGQTGTVLMGRLPDRVVVRIPEGCGLNGVQVGHSARTPPAVSFRRTFVLRPDVPLRAMTVVPALVSEPARELLKSQSEAELASVWLDEDGVLHWLGRKRMLAAPVVKTLSSSEIADAEITMDAQDVRRRVNVRWTAWAARVAKRSTIVVHEASKDEYEVDDYAEAIISPPDDEQWVAVDSTARQVRGGTNIGVFNSGQGTFVGWTMLTKDGDELERGVGATTVEAFDSIGPDTWKWSLRVDSLPGAAVKVRTASPVEPRAGAKPVYRDIGLPLVRAMGRATSSDETTSSRALGPAWAPELDHDTGWFVQGKAAAQELADVLIEDLMVQRPSIRGFKVLPDPRLQLGDKIRVEEQSRTGLSVVGVISEISQPISPGNHEMTLSLMVTEVQLSGVTWDEFDQWWDGATLAQVDAAYKGKTFAQHDRNPTDDE